MTLHQAASLSADAVTISIAFLLCAYIFKLSFDDAVTKIQWRQGVTLLVLIATASLCKFNIWPAFLTLLIPAGKFKTGRARWAHVAVYVFAALCVAASWQYLNQANIQRFAAFRAQEGVYVAENLRFIYHEPARFMWGLIHTIATEMPFYLLGFVGAFGWLSVMLPDILVWIYIVFLLTVACTQSRHVRLTWRQRCLLLLICMAYTVFAFIALWSIDIPGTYLRTVPWTGQKDIWGMQGRYFIPFALPLFVGVSTRKLSLDPQRLTTLAFGLIVTVNLVAFQQISYAFYFCH